MTTVSNAHLSGLTCVRSLLSLFVGTFGVFNQVPFYCRLAWSNNCRQLVVPENPWHSWTPLSKMALGLMVPAVGGGGLLSISFFPNFKITHVTGEWMLSLGSWPSPGDCCISLQPWPTYANISMHIVIVWSSAVRSLFSFFSQQDLTGCY